MKKIALIILLIPIAISCYSQKTESDSLFNKKYLGTWIFSDEKGFMLIDLYDFKNVMLYQYRNVEKNIKDIDPANKHWFYKSKGFVKNFHNNGVTIQTEQLLYIFYYRNDTLINMYEYGEGEKLVKLESLR